LHLVLPLKAQTVGKMGQTKCVTPQTLTNNPGPSILKVAARSVIGGTRVVRMLRNFAENAIDLQLAGTKN
jgi:hypothetical protein